MDFLLHVKETVWNPHNARKLTGHIDWAFDGLGGSRRWMGNKIGKINENPSHSKNTLSRKEKNRTKMVLENSLVIHSAVPVRSSLLSFEKRLETLQLGGA
jgi:hypothetical protein